MAKVASMSQGVGPTGIAFVDEKVEFAATSRGGEAWTVKPGEKRELFPELTIENETCEEAPASIVFEIVVKVGLPFPMILTWNGTAEELCGPLH